MHVGLHRKQACGHSIAHAPMMRALSFDRVQTSGAAGSASGTPAWAGRPVPAAMPQRLGQRAATAILCLLRKRLWALAVLIMRQGGLRMSRGAGLVNKRCDR